MEYAGEGYDLQKLINKCKSHEDETNHELDEKSIRKVMKQLLEGITYLHSNRICHRDIKPGNIYVTKDLNRLKILDLNVALQFKHDPNASSYTPTMFGVTGEEYYSAPELASGSYYDERVDCWSAGIVMF